MDPDVIFIIFLYFCLLILTIGSITGISKKVWKSGLSKSLKLLVIGLLIGLLILALYKFDSVETGSVVISRWKIMIYSASLLIGLNWSINLSKRPEFQRIKVNKYLKVTVLVVLITILIPVIFFSLANFLVKLNLLGSG
jgi:hypothetical protein